MGRVCNGALLEDIDNTVHPSLKLLVSCDVFDTMCLKNCFVFEVPTSAQGDGNCFVCVSV